MTLLRAAINHFFITVTFSFSWWTYFFTVKEHCNITHCIAIFTLILEPQIRKNAVKKMKSCKWENDVAYFRPLQYNTHFFCRTVLFYSEWKMSSKVTNLSVFNCCPKKMLVDIAECFNFYYRSLSLKTTENNKHQLKLNPHFSHYNPLHFCLI